MSKLSFFFVTLIVAIPAGFLGYLAVMAFLGHSGDMPAILMGVTGLTLLMCAVAVAMPVAVLLRRKPRTEQAEEAADAAPVDDEEFDEHDDEITNEDDAEVSAEDADEEDMDFDAFDDDERNR